MTKMMVVNFRGTELFGFEVGHVVVVALRPIVEGMGLAWSSQMQRVKRDPILSEGVFMINIPFGAGGPQQHFCLRLDLVHGWLFKVDANRVRDDIRDRVLLYQKECYAVLASHFSHERERLAHEASEIEGRRLRLVTEARQTFGPRAAAQLWQKLGLTMVPAMTESAVLAQGELFENTPSPDGIERIPELASL